MAVNMKITALWDVILHILEERYQHFGGTCCLHLQSSRVEHATWYLSTRQYGVSSWTTEIFKLS
jgi:hypothetical protein